MTLNEQLSQIMNSISELSKKIDDLNCSMKELNTKICNIDEKFSNRCNKLETELKDKVNKTDFVMLEHKVKTLECRISEVLKCSDTQPNKTELTSLSDKVDSLIGAAEKEKLRSEAYSMRLNLLIHGIPENPNNVWETRATTHNYFQEFLYNGLNISDPEKLQLVDIHRLPQRPIYKEDTRINRPIIIKLQSVDDKHWLFSRLKYLKEYNAAKKKENTETKPIYISEHLPKPYYEQKKKLLPLFKKAREKKQKTTWAVSDGDYCLFIDGVNPLKPSGNICCQLFDCCIYSSFLFYKQ